MKLLRRLRTFLSVLFFLIAFSRLSGLESRVAGVRAALVTMQEVTGLHIGLKARADALRDQLARVVSKPG